MTENTQTQENSNIIPVKRKRGRPAKVKVSHGVLPTDPIKTSIEDKNASKTKQEKLTQLLRATGSKYDTFDENEYRSRIESMTLTDLQEEAMRVGLKPNITIETRSISLDTLMDLFYDNKRSFIPDESGNNKTVLSEETANKLLELMKNAR